MAGIGPRGSVKSLHSNSSLSIQLPLVNHIRRLLPMFRDDVLHGEAGRGQPELLKGKFLEGGQIISLALLLTLCDKPRAPPSLPQLTSIPNQPILLPQRTTNSPASGASRTVPLNCERQQHGHNLETRDPISNIYIYISSSIALEQISN